MKLKNKILEASYHLLFFKPYTILPRRFEIVCGIVAWVGLGMVFYPFIKLFF